jgi:hypothetical protein
MPEYETATGIRSQRGCNFNGSARISWAYMPALWHTRFHATPDPRDKLAKKADKLAPQPDKLPLNADKLKLNADKLFSLDRCRSTTRALWPMLRPLFLFSPMCAFQFEHLGER